MEQATGDDPMTMTTDDHPHRQTCAAGASSCSIQINRDQEVRSAQTWRQTGPDDRIRSSSLAAHTAQSPKSLPEVGWMKSSSYIGPCSCALPCPLPYFNVLALTSCIDTFYLAWPVIKSSSESDGADLYIFIISLVVGLIAHISLLMLFGMHPAMKVKVESELNDLLSFCPEKICVAIKEFLIDDSAYELTTSFSVNALQISSSHRHPFAITVDQWCEYWSLVVS